MISSTPCTTGYDRNMPPEEAQAPIEITHFGSGIWSKMRFTAGAIFLVTVPATIIRSASRCVPSGPRHPGRLRSGARQARPLFDRIVPGPAHLQESLLVVDHLLTAETDRRVFRGQKNRLLRADLLAVAAHDAAQHVDVEDPRPLLDARVDLLRLDVDRLRRADILTQEAGHAFDPALVVAHQRRQAAVVLRDLPPLFRVLHRHFGAEHVPQGDPHPLQDRRKIGPPKEPRRAGTLYGLADGRHRAVSSTTPFSSVSRWRRSAAWIACSARTEHSIFA